MKIQPHTTKLTLLALFAGLFLASCKDKKTNTPSGPCTTCQSVMEAKDYFYFKVGSWWVYEEETSHERDSMYVTSSANDPNSYDFDVKIKSDLTDYTYHYWPVYYSGGGNGGCTPNGIAYKKCIHVKRSKYKFQDLAGESTVFFVKYNVGDFVYTGSELTYCPDAKMTIASVLDSYDLSNFQFGKTIVTEENCTLSEGKQPTKFHYSKGVGIIRKEFIDSNEVWNLVNYHIQE